MSKTMKYDPYEIDVLKIVLSIFKNSASCTDVMSATKEDKN